MGAPSPKLDRIWETHYDLTTGISKQEAEQLTVPTIEFPEGSGSYIVLLDIFHSLHCLNSLRKSLHPEYYPPSYLRHNMTEEDALRHTGRSTQFRMFNLGMNLACKPWLTLRSGGDRSLCRAHSPCTVVWSRYQSNFVPFGRRRWTDGNAWISAYMSWFTGDFGLGECAESLKRGSIDRTRSMIPHNLGCIGFTQHRYIRWHFFIASLWTAYYKVSLKRCMSRGAKRISSLCDGIEL